MSQIVKNMLAIIVLICTATVSFAGTKNGYPTVTFVAIPDIYAPPDRVSRWIGIIWAGDTNHPVIPIFYTVEPGVRPEGSLSRYVILTRAEYGRLSDFVRSYHCSLEEDIRSRSQSIGTQEFAHGRAQNICLLSGKYGCDFLFQLMALPSIDWLHKDNVPLYSFEGELGCKKR